MNARAPIAALLSLVFLAGCQKAGFKTNKEDVLAKASVFATSSASTDSSGSEFDGTDGQVKQDGRGRQDRDESGADGMLSETPEAVTRLCSDAVSSKVPNFKKAIAGNLPVTLTVNGQTCSTNLNAITSLVKKDMVSLGDVRPLCPNLAPPGFSAIVKVLVAGKSSPEGGGGLSVLWARNKATTPVEEAADSFCTRRASPLVIHLGTDPSRPSPVALSSIEKGVDFDLLGGRSRHMKVKIGWFTNHEYRFLTLPKSGAVKGIDELFGDNTLGPDGKYAANGYAALAKYDSVADGRIDKKDRVFSALRLWHDINLDGVAQSAELSPLAANGIEYIDLRYSSDYQERDQYGNETKMKSVVGFTDGSLDLIFDLWFRYKMISTAEQNAELFLTTLYQGLFGRSPDSVGLDYWKKVATEGRIGCATIAKSFLLSDEMAPLRAKVAVSDMGSTRLYIRKMYQGLLGRPVDASGFLYQVTVVLAGGSTNDLEDGILASQEFKKRCANYGLR